MDQQSLDGRVNRRTLLRGATVVAAATPVTVFLASEDVLKASDGALKDFSESNIFAGTVLAHPSPASIEIKIPGAERVLVHATPGTTLVHADGRAATLDQYSIGQAVTVTVGPGQDANEGGVVSARMTPAVLGEASDLDEIRD